METIRLSIWTPVAAKEVKQTIQQTGFKLYQENIYNEEYIDLNIEDSIEATNRIVECILRKCEMISTIIDEIIRSSNLK